MSAETFGFFGFRCDRGKRRDFAAPGIGKFKTHVTQVADTDSICRFDTECQQGRKHRNSTAKQWSCAGYIQKQTPILAIKLDSCLMRRRER